jgi:hypothetical protein
MRLPSDRLAAGRVGDRHDGSHVHTEPFDGVGAQLCPCSLATATPQTFTVAESVAYIVCQEVGIQSDDYSFDDVATWAGGGEEAQKAIKDSGSRIQKTADQILSALAAGCATSKEVA